MRLVQGPVFTIQPAYSGAALCIGASSSAGGGGAGGDLRRGERWNLIVHTQFWKKSWIEPAWEHVGVHSRKQRIRKRCGEMRCGKLADNHKKMWQGEARRGRVGEMRSSEVKGAEANRRDDVVTQARTAAAYVMHAYAFMIKTICMMHVINRRILA